MEITNTIQPASPTIPLVTQKLACGLRESTLKSTTAGFANAPVLIQYEGVCDRRFQGALTQPASQFLSHERYTYKMHPNLMVELQKLISQIFTQSTRITENNNKRTEMMKKDFQKFTIENAKWIRTGGNAGPLSASVSLGLLGASFFQVPDSNTRKLYEFLSSQTPQVASLFTSRYRSEQETASHTASLKLQEYTALSNNKQFDSELRQACLQILKEAQETETKAATARLT